MNEAWRLWRWTAACGGVVLVTLVTLVVQGDLWELLGVYHLNPYFVDLTAIFAAGQAKVAGLDVYQVNPFDPFGRPHVYGPLWLLSGPLGFTVADTTWAGALLGLAFLVVVLAAAAPRTPWAAVITALVLLSPPVLLGVDRANNDLVIVLLLAVSAVLATRGGWLCTTGGAAVLVFAAALKYYPLIALPALAARPEKIRRLALLGVACAMVFTVIWWLQRAEFHRMLPLLPRPRTIFAYGFPLITYAWNGHIIARDWFLAGMAVGFMIAGALLCGDWRKHWAAIPLFGGRAFAAVTGGACWVFCYFANSNYPYRTVLLLLVLPCWLLLAAQREDASTVSTGRRLCVLFVLSLWLATPKSWWAEVYLAGGPDALQASQWLGLFFGVEQALWLILTVALTVSLMGWAWRRLKAGPI